MEKFLGLSKFQRLVDMLASKPQIQETLTVKILEEIKNRLNPAGIGVVVKAIHTCVFARGVQSDKAEFTTNAMYGKFNENPQTRSEFLSCL
jgi:GTP cyclohydrolase I